MLLGLRCQRRPRLAPLHQQRDRVVESLRGVQPYRALPGPRPQTVRLVQCLVVPPGDLQHQVVPGRVANWGYPRRLPARLKRRPDRDRPGPRELCDGAWQRRQPRGAILLPGGFDQVARQQEATLRGTHQDLSVPHPPGSAPSAADSLPPDRRTRRVDGCLAQ